MAAAAAAAAGTAAAAPAVPPAPAESDPARSEAARERGNAALKAGDLAGAVAAYSEAIAADPRDPRAWSNRSLAHLRAGDLLPAFFDAYHVTHGLEPGNAKAWYRLGDVNMEMDRHAAALTCYTAAARAATDAAAKAEAEARARAAAAAVKAAAMKPPLEGLAGITPLPAGADPVFRVAIYPTRQRGTAEFPAAFRAGPGGPRHPDTVLAAMGTQLSTDAVQLVTIPGKGLGIVARRALPAHTEVHVEVPLLAIAAGRHRERCHHCTRLLPRGGGVPCTCDRVFCSDACKDTATTLYHGALCGAGGGKAVAVLEAAAAGDPKYASRCILLPWKLLGLSLTAAKATGTSPVSPLDLPPICYLHRPTDLAAPDTPLRSSLHTHVAAASFALVWSLFYDVLGADAPILLQLPPTWLLEVYSVLAANAFSLSGGSPGNPDGLGVVCAGSYFNHSCVPNTAMRSKVARGARNAFTTTRAVAVGEELTITYADDPTRSEQRHRLAAQYGFHCVCAECREEDRLAAAGVPGALTARQRAAAADRRNDRAAMFAALTDVIAADPGDPVPWAHRSVVGVLVDDSPLRSYCDAYHVVHHLDPRNGMAWHSLGGAQAAMGQGKAGLDSVRKAIAVETDPENKAMFERSLAAGLSHGGPPTLSMTGSPGKYELRCMRTVGAFPGLLPLPSAFRAGPGGPRRLDAVLAAVADTRSSDWVRFEAVPGKGVGVVAARDIPAGTTVHVEKAALATTLPPAGALICYHCLVPVTAATAVPCACDRVYCSDACKATALQYYHAATCGAGGGRADATLEEVARTDPDFGMRALLLPWKLLGWALTVAKAAHAPAASPADLPPFCYMDRATDLAAPPPRSRAATASGVMVNPGVFTCAWGLFHDLLGGDAVMARMAPEWLLDAMTVMDTNAVVPPGKRVEVIARGCAVFNHSCEPNAAFVIDVPTTGSQLTVVTSRPVAAGEEVTVSYAPPGAPFTTRRAFTQLRGFICTCRRCLVEERDEATRGGPPEGMYLPGVDRRALPPLPVPTRALAAASHTHTRV